MARAKDRDKQRPVASKLTVETRFCMHRSCVGVFFGLMEKLAPQHEMVSVAGSAF